MNYNAYSVLGLTSGATREEIDRRYYELRKQYSADRFLPGLAGEEASEKLQAVEVAYRDILNELAEEKVSHTAEVGDKYGEVKKLITDGKLDDAQEILDLMTERDAEWHYVQSLLFYKRNWFLESKKQLEFAVQLEPQNQRYRESLDKLVKVLSSKTISPDQMRTTATPTGGIGAGNGTCTGTTCGDCLLANVCCNCMSCMGGCR